jgi:hypothetical protein
MDYIKEIEYQIEIMREFNMAAQDSGIAMTIAMLAEKAFHMSQKTK